MKIHKITLKATYIEIILFSVGLMGFFSTSFAQDFPWVQKADMPTGRHSFAASVVDGKIYVAGGRYTPNLLNVYDPATDTWTTKESMPTPRMALSGCTVNGKFYALGGITTAYQPALSTVEEYDPATDTWTKKKDMPTKRLGLGTSVVDGKIYAIGGMTSGSNFWSGMQSCVEVYDPETDSWSTAASMPTQRCWFTVSVVDGKIYAIGGALVTKQPLAVVEVYDPATDTWTTKASMPTARTAHCASVVNGIIYVIGGGTVSANPGGFTVVEAYDPESDTWIKKADIPVPRASMSAPGIDEKIYVIGGIPTFANPHLHGVKTVYEYTPSSGTTSVRDQFEGLNYPIKFRLHQNYPNPFNPATTIEFTLPVRDLVSIKVYDINGRKVTTLVNTVMDAGSHTVLFDASQLASGLYYYQLQAGSLTETKKMLLVR